MKTLRILTTALALSLVTCAGIPYTASISYGGASARYDGKRVLVDVDAGRMFNDIRGYSK